MRFRRINGWIRKIDNMLLIGFWRKGTIFRLNSSKPMLGLMRLLECLSERSSTLTRKGSKKKEKTILLRESSTKKLQKRREPKIDITLMNACSDLKE